MIVSSPRTTSEVASIFFFTHDIFGFDARVVKRIRGCVADVILVVVYDLVETQRQNR